MKINTQKAHLDVIIKIVKDPLLGQSEVALELLADVLVGRLEGVGVSVPHGTLHWNQATLAADAETTVVQRVAVDLAAPLLEDILPGEEERMHFKVIVLIDLLRQQFNRFEINLN